MGIPSYYRTLIVKMPHAIQKKAPTAASALVVDMNCMIYHVLREPQMLAISYPGDDGRLAWERKLQEEVCKYLTHIWRSAGAPLQMYVGLDGVVPYAKIKQQRFRRFKSASLAAKVTECWDTNAITPGTDFMRNMGDALRTTASKHGWVISDTSEPGEGEHKLLRWLLKTPINPGPIVVYGLDADLILLCLLAGDRLGPSYPISLMRESQAFGKLVRPPEGGEVELGFFSTEALKKSLEAFFEKSQQKSQQKTSQPPAEGGWSRTQLYDYVFGMSFCGNDFLPTGLSLRIRDDGHAILLDCLHQMWQKGLHLVEWEDKIARPNAQGLKFLTGWMAREESRLIIKMIKRKQSAPFSDDDDSLPIREQAESPLVYKGPRGLDLRPGWQKLYNARALGDSSESHRKSCVAEFWRGWCWILDYYQGLPVDTEWVYANGYPPLWSDLRDFFVLPEPGSWDLTKPPLEPQEQLALVLPMRSWNLHLRTAFRDLPAKLPQYWPEQFHVETFGKRFGWECEPEIPMLTPARLRYENNSSTIHSKKTSLET